MAASIVLARFLSNNVRTIHLRLTRSVQTTVSVHSAKLPPPSDVSVEQEQLTTTAKSDGIEVDPEKVRHKTESTHDQESVDSSGLAKTFAMFERVERAEDLKSTDGEKGKPLLSQIKKLRPSPRAQPQESFVTMLRKSKLMQVGDPEGRVVIGTIGETMADDLYIDFGGKFDCVCKRPKARASEYKKGAKVRIRLLDLELSSLFMGASRDITLLEADATLLGLYKGPGTGESEPVDLMEEK